MRARRRALISALRLWLYSKRAVASQMRLFGAEERPGRRKSPLHRHSGPRRNRGKGAKSPDQSPQFPRVVPIHIADAHDCAPRQFRMAFMQRGRQASRRFGNDFQRPRHRLKPRAVGFEDVEGNTRDKFLGESHIVRDIEQSKPRPVRKHRWRHARPPAGRKLSICCGSRHRPVREKDRPDIA